MGDSQVSIHHVSRSERLYTHTHTHGKLVTRNNVRLCARLIRYLDQRLNWHSIAYRSLIVAHPTKKLDSAWRTDEFLASVLVQLTIQRLKASGGLTYRWPKFKVNKVSVKLAFLPFLTASAFKILAERTNWIPEISDWISSSSNKTVRRNEIITSRTRFIPRVR